MYVAPSSLLTYSMLYCCKGGMLDTSKSISPAPTLFTCAACKLLWCWSCPAAVKVGGGGRSAFTVVPADVFFAARKRFHFSLKYLLDTTWISSSNSSCSSRSKVLIICLARPPRTNSTGWSSCYAILSNLLNCSSRADSDFVFRFLPGRGCSLSLPVDVLVLTVTSNTVSCPSAGSAWVAGAGQFDVAL